MTTSRRAVHPTRRTVTHDEPLEPDASGQIPPYDVSEAARGRTTAQLFQDVLDDRAMKRATGGLLDHRSMTIEFLWAESLQRDRWSAADRAAQPTDAEAARLAAAEAAYAGADATRKQARTAIGDARRALGAAVSAAAGEGVGRIDDALGEWSLRPSRKPEEVRAAEKHLDAARRAYEQAEEACAAALVRLNNVRSNHAIRQQARRAGAQNAINRSGFLDNLKRYGGQLTADVRAAMARHYGR